MFHRENTIWLYKNHHFNSYFVVCVYVCYNGTLNLHMQYMSEHFEHF